MAFYRAAQRIDDARLVVLRRSDAKAEGHTSRAIATLNRDELRRSAVELPQLSLLTPRCARWGAKKLFSFCEIARSAFRCDRRVFILGDVIISAQARRAFILFVVSPAR